MKHIDRLVAWFVTLLIGGIVIHSIWMSMQQSKIPSAQELLLEKLPSTGTTETYRFHIGAAEPFSTLLVARVAGTTTVEFEDKTVLSTFTRPKVGFFEFVDLPQSAKGKTLVLTSSRVDATAGVPIQRVWLGTKQSIWRLVLGMGIVDLAISVAYLVVGGLGLWFFHRKAEAPASRWLALLSLANATMLLCSSPISEVIWQSHELLTIFQYFSVFAIAYLYASYASALIPKATGLVWNKRIFGLSLVGIAIFYLFKRDILFLFQLYLSFCTIMFVPTSIFFYRAHKDSPTEVNYIAGSVLLAFAAGIFDMASAHIEGVPRDILLSRYTLFLVMALQLRIIYLQEMRSREVIIEYNANLKRLNDNITNLAIQISDKMNSPLCAAQNHIEALMKQANEFTTATGKRLEQLLGCINSLRSLSKMLAELREKNEH